MKVAQTSIHRTLQKCLENLLRTLPQMSFYEKLSVTLPEWMVSAP
jgi:hypothetical protein